MSQLCESCLAKSAAAIERMRVLQVAAATIRAPVHWRNEERERSEGSR